MFFPQHLSYSVEGVDKVGYRHDRHVLSQNCLTCKCQDLEVDPSASQQTDRSVCGVDPELIRSWRSWSVCSSAEQIASTCTKSIKNFYVLDSGGSYLYTKIISYFSSFGDVTLISFPTLSLLFEKKTYRICCWDSVASASVTFMYGKKDTTFKWRILAYNLAHYGQTLKRVMCQT